MVEINVNDNEYLHTNLKSKGANRIIYSILWIVTIGKIEQFFYFLSIDKRTEISSFATKFARFDWSQVSINKNRANQETSKRTIMSFKQSFTDICANSSKDIICLYKHFTSETGKPQIFPDADVAASVSFLINDWWTLINEIKT